MTSRQWYFQLLEDNVTMDTSTPRKFISSRAEALTPDIDWKRIWRLARLKGLTPDQTSFLWRLLHQLLPTLSRVHRMTPNTSPNCKHCEDGVVEDLQHALISCPFNIELSQALMNILSVYQPNLDPAQALTLNFEMEEHMELPLVWLTTNVFQEIWNNRKEKKRCVLVRARADLEARVSLLRRTRFAESATVISQMLYLYLYLYLYL